MADATKNEGMVAILDGCVEIGYMHVKDISPRAKVCPADGKTTTGMFAVGPLGNTIFQIAEYYQPTIRKGFEAN